MKFARSYEWRGDGTVVGSDTAVPLQRAIVEAGELERLLDALSETIGMSVDRFLVESQKNVGKALYTTMPARHFGLVPNRRYLRPLFIARLFMRPVSDRIAELGNGRPSIEEYRAGCYWVLRFCNPCVIPMLIGSSMGIFESMEKTSSSRYEHRLEGEDLLITIRHGGTAPCSEKRLYLEEVRPGGGPFRFDRCPDCSAPLPAALCFDWDIDSGFILNRLTGKREVVVAVQSLNAMVRELESELGDEIPGILYETQKRLEGERLTPLGTGTPGVFWDGYLTDLAVHGLGYPLEFEAGTDRVAATTGNTYNQLLYAARLAAGLEKLTGRGSRIEWSQREQYGASFVITV